MNARRLVSAFVVVVVSLTASLAHAGDTYKIDSAHTFAIFRVQHAGAGYTYGRINNPTGTIVVDAADPTKTSFDVQLELKNLDTANAQRDTHLKGPDFFSVAEFPTMTFKSTAVKSAGDKKLDVTGDLTIHGQTKSITVTIEATGTSSTMGQRTGFESTFTIKRSDYGMTKMIPGAGDEVRITISLEGVKQ